MIAGFIDMHPNLEVSGGGDGTDIRYVQGDDIWAIHSVVDAQS